MSADSLNLTEVQNVEQLLSRTPNGSEVLRLARQLGLITPSDTTSKHAFKRDVASLTPQQISNEQGHWAGEFGRICELLGLLTGQERYLAIRAKEVRARERGQIRRNEEALARTTLEEADPAVKTAKKVVKKSATEINDLAEEAPAVRTVEEQGTIVVLLLASAQAAKEAVTMYLSTLSREISFRAAQMDARLYSN